MTDSRDLSPQEVSLLAWERRNGVTHICIQISSHDVLALLSCLDVVWLSVRQLDPVVTNVFSDPVDFLVDTVTSLLDDISGAALLAVRDLAFHNEVVVTCAIDLAPESQTGSATHGGKSLQTLVQTVVLVLAK